MAPLKNGDWVRLLVNEYGVMEGPSASHGAGQYREWEVGSTGEVVDVDGATGYVTVIIPHDFGGPNTPYHTRIILSSDQVEKVPRPGLPDIELPDPPDDI